MGRPVSESGHRLVVEADHALPLVHVHLLLPTGGLQDPKGRAGLTRLTAQMLRRGTTERDAQAFEAALDTLGAELTVETGWGHLRLAGSVLKRNLEPFMALLGEALSAPSLAAEPLEQLKNETLAALIEARDRDQSLVASHFRRAQFKGHAYGGSLVGNRATLEGIGADQVREVYESRIRGSALTVGFAGDVSAEEAAQLMARHLPAALPGQWQRPEPSVPEQAPGRRLRLVDKPERSQCQIYIGRLGTLASDDDHHALIVADAVFGGTFTARLTREVRSERGWSYGASSHLSVDRVRDTWSMWTFPAAGDTEACIRLQLQLMERWYADGIDAEELAFAQSYLTKSRAFAVDTASKRLEQDLEAGLCRLPDDYWPHYEERIRAVTVEQASAAVRARLDPRALTIALVATASDLEAPLRSLPLLTDVEVVPFDADT